MKSPKAFMMDERRQQSRKCAYLVLTEVISRRIFRGALRFRKTA